MLSLTHLSGSHLLILLSSSSTSPSLGTIFWSLMSRLFSALYLASRALPIIYATHYSKCPFTCLTLPPDRGCQTLSVKHQIVFIAGFVGHEVSVIVTQFGNCSVKAAIDNKNDCFNKILFTKTVGGEICPMGCSF